MGEKRVCKNCGKEFDSGNTADRCRYHPKESEHVGTADSHYDFSEVYKYPCCGQLEFPEATSAPPALGCVEGTHEAKN